MRPSKILIIIPTYNEAENVEAMVMQLLSMYAGIHILIVDDFSPDGTYKIVREMQNSISQLHLILKDKKEGLGKAYTDGFQWAIEQNKDGHQHFERIVTMDCDFSHDPSQVLDLIIDSENYGLVVGSRYVDEKVRIVNWPLKRLILSKLAAWYSRFWTLMPITDPTGGFNCYDINLLAKIDLQSIKSNGYCFQVEMKYLMWKLGAKLTEYPITFIDREHGTSKMSRKIVWEAILKIPFLRFK